MTTQQLLLDCIKLFKGHPIKVEELTACLNLERDQPLMPMTVLMLLADLWQKGEVQLLAREK